MGQLTKWDPKGAKMAVSNADVHTIAFTRRDRDEPIKIATQHFCSEVVLKAINKMMRSNP